MLIKKRIKPRCIALLAVLLAALFISRPCALAQQTAFHEDYAAIDRAAQSVVLLEVYDQTEKLVATGSGFVAFDNQTVVTNYHVIEGAYLIKAYGDAGFFYRINDVIAADESKDIAILSFESPSIIQPLELAHDAKLMRGEPVVAIGSPVGIKNTVSMGNISTLLEDDVGTVIQFTAPISHGSSGGALFNARGQVIGVTFATLEAGQNLNYAVDIDDVLFLYANHNQPPMSFTDYFASLIPTPAPTPEPTPRPTPRPVSQISDLAVTQVGPHSVELKWKENTNHSFLYGIAIYLSNESSMIHYEQVNDTTCVIEWLSPGYEYTFSVSSGLSTIASAKIMLPEAGKLKARNFKAKSFAMYYHNAGEDFEEAKRKKISTITLEDAKKAGLMYDYMVVTNYTIGEASEASTWECFYTVIGPEGFLAMYPFEMTFEKEKESDFIVGYLNDLMARIAGNNKKGIYNVKLYIDGQYVTKTGIKVK